MATGSTAEASSKRAAGLTSARLPALASRALLYAVAILTAVVFMLPFAWAFFSSLKSSQEIFEFPPRWLPAVPQWSNYADVLTTVPFARWTWNTFVITVLSLIGTVLSASLVAYSFARFRYPGRDLLFLITISTLMLPLEVTLIPQYLIFRDLQWLDTFLPLIVPSFFGGGAFAIFLLRQFFLTIPIELDEAARIDGASSWHILWSIILPLSGPALATVAVLHFIGTWHAFLVPLVFLNTPDNFTVSVGLRYFVVPQGAGVEKPRDQLLMATSLMVAAPCVLLFFLAQKYFVRGIVMSGIKG